MESRCLTTIQTLLSAAVFAALGLANSSAFAQSYPAKPMRRYALR